MKKDEAVKSEILERAEVLFQQYGLKKTTMDDIAEACKKAKSTLYHYFRSKEEVFDGVIRLELIKLRKAVAFKIDREEGLLDKIMTYFIEFHKEVVDRLNLYRIIKGEMKDVELAGMQFVKVMEFEKSFIERLLEEAYDRGEYTNVDKSDIPMFAEISIAAMLGIVQYTIQTDNGLDYEKLDKVIRTIIPQLFT